MIWEVVGADGRESDAVVAGTKSQFEGLPDGVDQQISDYLNLLVSRGLLEKL